ncbi:MAG: hypothetical protein WB684_01535, partial [Gaiella sp.]
AWQGVGAVDLDLEAAVLEGGKAGLGGGGKPGVNPRERAMLDEIEELKAAHRRWQQRERQGVL